MKVQQNPKAESVNEFLGVSDKRAEQLAEVHSEKFSKAIKGFIESKEDDDHQRANMLLASCLEDCETIEEVVLISVGFQKRLVDSMRILQESPLMSFFKLISNLR